MCIMCIEIAKGNAGIDQVKQLGRELMFGNDIEHLEELQRAIDANTPEYQEQVMDAINDVIVDMVKEIRAKK